MNDIQFIYFDVGGVLIDWKRAFQTAANTFQITVKDIGTVFEENHDNLTKGIITSQDLWHKVVQRYNLHHADNYDFVASWVSDYRPITQVHELVYKIKSKYKIGLLSNIYTDMLPLLLKKKIIPKISYKAIIFSCDVSMMKPHRNIYELAQQKAGVGAQHILFIDDREDYLEQAKKLQWQTFLFDYQNVEGSAKALERRLC